MICSLRMACCRAVAAAMAFLTSSPWLLAGDVAATWDDSFLNNWSDVARWTTAPDVSPVVPSNGTTTFDVVIDAGNVVQDVAGGVTINNLDLVDAFLSGSQSVTIVGEAGEPLAISTWAGVTQNTEIWNTGGITVGESATLAITGAGFKGLGAPDNNDEVDDIATLSVEGSATLSGGAIVANGEGGHLDITSTGSFDWMSDAGFSGFAAGTITNAGTITKSAGTGLAQIGGNWTMANTGTFRVESGTVRMSSATNGFFNDAVVEVAGTGATLQVGGGTSTGTFDVAMDSTLTISSSNVTIKHTIDGGNAGIANAGTLNINGNVDFVNDASLTGSGSVNLIGGAIGGSASLGIKNLTWTGGRIGNTAGVTIPVGSNATLSGGWAKGLSSGGRLIVEGTATVTGGGNIDTTAAAATPAEIAIVAGGLLDLQTDADFTNANQLNRGGVITNEGTLHKSGGTGVTQVESAWTVSNAGVIDVDSGTLELEAAFAHTGSGSIDVAGGATLRFDGPVSGANSYLGEGRVVFNHNYTPGASLAEVSFAGDVTFGANSDLFLELGGTADGEFDALDIAGDLTFLGDLHLSLIELVPDGGVFEPRRATRSSC